MGVLFGALGTGVRMLAKQAGKRVAESSTMTPKVVGHTPITDVLPGATVSGVQGLIDRAHTVKELKVINDYLHSSKNTIPHNTTQQLINVCVKHARTIRMNQDCHHLADALYPNPFDGVHHVLTEIIKELM